MAPRSSRAPAIQNLASAAFNYGEVVDHASIASRLAGNSHGIAQVPIAEHQSVQMHHAVVDRDLNVTVIEIWVGMEGELHAIPQISIRNRDIRSRSRGVAAQRDSQKGTNGRGLEVEGRVHGGLR